jgi:hypothetical protein
MPQVPVVMVLKLPKETAAALGLLQHSAEWNLKLCHAIESAVHKVILEAAQANGAIPKAEVQREIPTVV